jgi:hypothetical protein
LSGRCRGPISGARQVLYNQTRGTEYESQVRLPGLSYRMYPNTRACIYPHEGHTCMPARVHIPTQATVISRPRQPMHSFIPQGMLTALPALGKRHPILSHNAHPIDAGNVWPGLPSPSPPKPMRMDPVSGRRTYVACFWVLLCYLRACVLGPPPPLGT